MKRPAAGVPLSASRASELKPESGSESKSDSKSPVLAKDARNGAPGVAVGPVAHLVAVAAQTAAAAAPAMQRVVATPAVPKDNLPEVPAAAPGPMVVAELATAMRTEIDEATMTPVAETTEVSSPEFVLSAELEPPQSWLRANIFVIVVVLLVAAGVALTLILH